MAQSHIGMGRVSMQTFKTHLLAAIITASAIVTPMMVRDIGALAAGDTDEDFTVVADFATFKSHLIGPRITDPQNAANFFVINGDGTLNGTWHGKALSGKWRWEDKYFCRSLSAPRPAPEDCQQWSLAAGKARLIRNRGAGKSAVYVLEK